MPPVARLIHFQTMGSEIEFPFRRTIDLGRRATEIAVAGNAAIFQANPAGLKHVCRQSARSQSGHSSVCGVKAQSSICNSHYKFRFLIARVLVDFY